MRRMTTKKKKSREFLIDFILILTLITKVETIKEQHPKHQSINLKIQKKPNINNLMLLVLKYFNFAKVIWTTLINLSQTKMVEIMKPMETISIKQRLKIKEYFPKVQPNH